MATQLKQHASANGTKQESGVRPRPRRADHPGTRTSPRGNGTADTGEVLRSVQRLHGVLGH